MPEFAFDNSYVKLGNAFYALQAPTPVPEPSLIKLNSAFAEQLGLPVDEMQSDAGLQILSGNKTPEGAAPMATAYAGHQFGGWVPRLGDGRAVLLGEVLDRHGERFDIQLKGAGRTPFSRHGDGRAPIGPVLREYLISEAMHALGIPTTRALAAVRTGTVVHREENEPGAILTRVAQSHIRVGTFQYFAAQREHELIKQLAMHVIQRHYPHAADANNPFLALLEEVCRAQASLVAKWQSVGFIHGVMNTDNASVAGLTIDYGPCAFMDAYDPAKVYSSIDHAGRYAYQNQPGIAQWNMANLAQCLLPWIDSDSEKAVAQAQDVIDQFPDIYEAFYQACFRRKLGLQQSQTEDSELIGSLLTLMQKASADFTQVFRSLANGTSDTMLALLCNDNANSQHDIKQWMAAWSQRCNQEDTSQVERTKLMQSANPAYVPRNHQIEHMIAEAKQNRDQPFEALLETLMNPYQEQPGKERFALAPLKEEEVLATFCGT